jgi:hypothetical protein
MLTFLIDNFGVAGCVIAALLCMAMGKVLMHLGQ